MAVQRIRFDNVRAQLDAAMALCKNLGLGNQARRGRFGEYRRTVVAAVDRVHAGRPGPSGLDAQRDAVALIEPATRGTFAVPAELSSGHCSAEAEGGVAWPCVPKRRVFDIESRAQRDVRVDHGLQALACGPVPAAR